MAGTGPAPWRWPGSSLVPRRVSALTTTLRATWRGGVGGGAAEALDEGVGEELGAGAVVAGGAGLVGGGVEGGDDRGDVGGGQEGGELAHAVAEDAGGDVASGAGAGVAGDPAGFVAAQDLAAHEVAQVGIAEPVQAVGEGGVDALALVGGEVGGLGGDDLGAAFVEVAAFEGGEGLGEVGEQGAGQAELAASLVGGLAAGQGDLEAGPGVGVGPAAAGSGVEHPAGVGLGLAVLVEVVGQAGLGGADGGLEAFELVDLLDDGVGVGGQGEGHQGGPQGVDRLSGRRGGVLGVRVHGTVGRSRT